ncbi:protein MLN51 homolog isoform X1 [Punica granatum]|uniref:Protein MLN51 homolog isoform X1 n=1 Tax=Punica granatum TaxID=22663 RepID=A0A6P8CWT8_PUNGR|nr:protein MLN51 homolog isoform X1 [Punica granatum]XP_031386489.1 protein MLN51 homolog isoform X1 [Punica granatum]XP_031386490.1 protein MLN51 homolog isoform X1 [Punica granatum]
MAAAGEEEVEYESDPEEAKQSLVMRRRRAASDDEDSEEEGGAEQEREGPDQEARIHHSDESDGQGGAANYDDDEEEEYIDEEEEGAYNEEEELIDDEEVRRRGLGSEDVRDRVDEEKKVAVAGVSESAAEEFGDAPPEGQANQDGEKKSNEPYAVPTAGAFYMHDDRFRDNAGGRHRRTFGGRKLWESKDERKWGHDKFEEMSMQERHYEERRRNTRGRGRGRNRGLDRGYGRGNRSKPFDNNSSTGAATNSNNNQAAVPRTVRGRGPRRYDHSLRKSNQGSPSQNKQSKSGDNPQHGNSAQTYSTTSNVESDSAPMRRNAIGSILSSASPPFYPSGSSNKEGGLSQKKDMQAGNSNRNSRPPSMDDNFSLPQSNPLLRGKNVSNPIGTDKLSIDDLVTAFSGKSFSPVQAAASGSPPISSSQPSQGRAQGRGAAPAAGQMAYPSTLPQGQVNKVSPQVQAHNVQRGPAPNRVQPCTQQLGQCPGSGSQASSPPKTANSVNSYDTGESDTLSESSKSKGALVAKGKGSIQGSGRGSFIYGGAHVMGASGPMGVGRGDQNFPGTPAFLPVMQFRGQHPGGIGVPAVGMAFPGYVAQPQLGLGNSEMTWLPVLAGAAGALGATYCSPYLAVDGSYHAPPSGQTTAASTTSKESNANKPNNESKPPEGTEAVNEEQGQRQNKARRYSEMNFGQ